MKTELQGVIALIIILGFLALLFLNYGEHRKLELLTQYNETCTTLSDNLGFYLNESSNITCNCFYEALNTGVEELDEVTTPFCTCDCLRNGVRSRIAIRAYEG